MKIKNKIIVFILILSVAFINTTCKKRLFKKITYQGIVYDHQTSGVPVAGIKVTLRACGGGGVDGDQSTLCSNHKFIVGESTTDASGHFYINEKAAASDNYFVDFNGGVSYPPLSNVSGSNLKKNPDIYMAP